MSKKEIANHLLIVESPAKSKTISRFLGKGYEVASSFGHIRDLKTKGMGVDIENNFAPDYEISEDKSRVVKDLRDKAKKADKVWLASDEDREGEAIAWHLSEVLGLDINDNNRIVFHEITPNAIENALANPRKIDMEMVDAQQARRVLDRIVGFELSPVLWQKVRPGLSAGRVQSVAVRILVEREREINAFVPESSYRVRATFVTDRGEAFTAELDKRLSTYDEAKALLESLKDDHYHIENIDVKPAQRHPAPPFTTSTLQQEASRRLGMPVGVTMRVAQSLYESGYITYMRTDSVNLSTFAIAQTAKEVESQFGNKYVKTRNFKTSTKGAQEAHEAIRPTHVERETVPGTRQEKALYDLIRKRTIATQMAPAQLERTQVDIISSGGKHFIAKGEVVKFDGFLKVYLEGNDDEPSNDSDMSLLPALHQGEALQSKEVIATERFTQRPPRYTEAALVKKMEELGIGRPSTYATTIQTIQKRGYVDKLTLEGTKRSYQELKLAAGKVTSKEKKEVYGADRQKLVPSDVGMVVNDFLVEYFPRVLDYNFTANVEKEFDAIAEGKKPWTKVINSFYLFFHDNVTTVQSERMDHKVGERLIGTDPATGENVYAKIGPYGPMVQLGDSGEENKKPRFASVPKQKSIETITLDEALVLFQLPRTLGEYEGEEILANNGRFGPYVKFGSLFASIPKDQSVFEITLDDAIELIKKKQEQERQRHITSFGPEDDLIEIQNGRWGPFIKYKKKNYRLPKDVDPLKLTEEEVREIIAGEQSTSKKSTTKKSTTKKATAKKSSDATKMSTTKKAASTKKSAAKK